MTQEKASLSPLIGAPVWLRAENLCLSADMGLGVGRESVLGLPAAGMHCALQKAANSCVTQSLHSLVSFQKLRDFPCPVPHVVKDRSLEHQAVQAPGSIGV